MSDIKIIETKDGSSSLFIPSMDETYHSTHGAITESEYVFLAKGLSNYQQQHPKQAVVNILEIGFGTGLNPWLTALATLEGQQQIHFTSLEKFPLSDSLIAQLNYTAQKDTAESKEIFAAIHECPWEKEVEITSFFSLLKLETDFLTYQAEAGSFDVIYFDAFAPSKQSEMWSLELFEKLFSMLSSDGVLVTYCAQGQFKRDLRDAGFTVETLEGPPGKKQMTRGLKP